MSERQTIWAREWFVPACVAVLALAIRWYYVHTAVVVNPIRGDAVQYMIYAINLLDHGVFSLQRDAVAPVADGFRDPGYPVFLATAMAVFGRGPAFYLAMLDAQAILAGLTVGMGAWLTRRFVGLGASVAAGFGLAVWPHLITASGYLLSETLLGFLVMSGLALLALAIDRRSTPLAATSGLVFAATALTNAVLLPLLPVFALVAAWKDPGRRRLWAALALAAFLPCAAWLGRNATLDAPPGDNRVMMNFVQGSWPSYHAAWRDAFIRQDPAGTAELALIDTEYRRMLADPHSGFGAVVERLRQTPAESLGWYASKPSELWGWTIGIGAGDIYVFPTQQSPLAGRGILPVVTGLCYALTPLLALLALAGAIAALVGWRACHPVLWLMVIMLLFVTAVFTVLQADARYATPYRCVEWLLAVYALHRFAAFWRRKRRAT
ncbi:hypothetical protein KPL74_11645 [Bacillus sp. NP157]|nr:hypothetical protein KPL74_11645 [Bacillus sp. NP157]